MNELISTIALWALPVLFAITLHEAAHGYVARYFGDRTAELAGRITLNPIKHIDPVGTILVPLGIVLLSSLMGGVPFLFGWAKPVPVNFNNLRNPKANMLWVAAAGPLSNFAMATGWAILAWLGMHIPLASFNAPLVIMAKMGVEINLVLMVLNLLPIPPLDGGRIVTSLLPLRYAIPYMRLEPFGFPILLVLLFTQMLGYLIYPPINMFLRFFTWLFGI